MAGIDQLQIDKNYKGITPELHDEAKEVFEREKIGRGFRFKAFLILVLAIGITAALNEVKAGNHDKDSEVTIPYNPENNQNIEVIKDGMKVVISKKMERINIELSPEFFKKLSNSYVVVSSSVEGDDPATMEMVKNKIWFNLNNILKDIEKPSSILCLITGYDEAGNSIDYSMSVYFDGKSSGLLINSAGFEDLRSSTE